MPVDRIRAAVEEYCRAGTGHRPTCIDWTAGQMSGRRLDMDATPECGIHPELARHLNLPQPGNLGRNSGESALN
ncbi:Imm1 family immunity protein [Streptomyces sp. NBC_00198]|uniref:Imm1 family immunity protein n=1 Tax=Streptomyces sp. NBC_00198 TaxID=2975677 RepID=UPI00338E88CB